MPIVYEKLLNYPIPEMRQHLRWQDVAMYNFSVGLGQDPMDEQQLDFLYEPRLKVMPSMPVVLGAPGFWSRNPDTGMDWVKILHGEQGLILHKPLLTEGEIIGRSRVTGLVDRGEGKGALMYSERQVIDAKTGDLLATVTSTSFLRGDGGFGGPSGPVKKPHPEPERAPDVALDFATRPEQALIYRLNTDLNPLHIDPKIAAAAGYPRPILHGLCTFGTICHALLKTLCNYDTARFGQMDLRFSSPVYPGETIRTEIWHEAGGAAFRARVVERDKVVVSNGLFRFA
ncbi:MAG: MaoC family dehydratase N-terminal domain-containing protein [Roseomonas sp.]|nr:MaoC family dehydratase N-terminal domain-containing protein [Roseomonas sp.]MCA3326951.1 MaoC family dehydratase N-terminal domain-containing protein [Roseomonas sp.]MCA3330865.1 MaoC family dehydratase N-terminal domain-containing protein [Roseomonas sp.]MCA3333948.1 MaoC family dehydratase N-terminal domain-containing protein [Roseomonas sp.]MCA3346557.1 MaoC family dehydratase N-terminal domain-containing protein [Roseomonas sp.]